MYSMVVKNLVVTVGSMGGEEVSVRRDLSPKTRSKISQEGVFVRKDTYLMVKKFFTVLFCKKSYDEWRGRGYVYVSL